MRPAGPSWRNRLDRVDARLEELERERQNFFDSDPYPLEFRTAKHALLPEQFVVISLHVGVRAEIPDVFAELAGEVAYGLRSALDRLAWRLVTDAGGNGDRSEFPIFTEQSRFESEGLRKIRGVAPEVASAMEALQPYHLLASEPQPKVHPLLLIHELRRVDFHRHAAFTGTAVALATMKVAKYSGAGFNMERGEDGRPKIESGALEDGKRLTPITFRLPIDELEGLKLAADFDVSFGPGAPGAGEPVLHTLQELRRHVAEVVFPALEPLIETM